MWPSIYMEIQPPLLLLLLLPVLFDFFFLNHNSLWGSDWLPGKEKKEELQRRS